MSNWSRWSLTWVLVAAVAGCGDSGGGSGTDGGDAAVDAGSDAGEPDGGADGGPSEAGTDATTDAARDAGPTGCTSGCEVVEVVAGTNYSCARRANGEVRCWGGNYFRQLGDGRERHGRDCAEGSTAEYQDCTTRPVQVMLPGPATAIFATGGFATCALVEEGGTTKAYCWGRSPEYPTSGMGLLLRETPTEVTAFEGADWLSTNGFTECAVTSGEVRCWGTNSKGQLGLGGGDFMWRNEPVAMTLGDEVTPRRVEVAAGPHATFVCVAAEGGVYCTGSNTYGQLGDGSADHGESCGAMGLASDCSSSPVAVSGLGTVADLALGRHHACALVPGDGDSNELRCWGRGSGGQLGMAMAEVVREPAAPSGAGFENLVQVTAGDYFTCGRYADGSVRCWGANDYAQLGDGLDDHDESCIITNDRLGDCSTAPVTVALPDGRTAVDVAAGYRHACAALDDGSVACWGYNRDYQTGNSDRSNQYTPFVVTLP